MSRAVASFAAVLFAAVGLALVGCGDSGGSPGKPPPHTAQEEAAIKAAQAKTPEQRIDEVNADPRYTPEQKASLIQSIRG